MKEFAFEMNKSNLLKRIAAGEQQAVEDCIEKYGNLIWALAKRYSQTHEDAEDAVQEVFTEIWKNASRYDETKAAESTFITTIARRRLIDRLRKVYRRPQACSIENTLVTNSCEPTVFQKMQAKEIVKAMRILRPEQRELMFLNIYDGMSHREIAERTGVPLGTVKTHIRRGFEKIRQIMKYQTEIESNIAIV